MAYWIIFNCIVSIIHHSFVKKGMMRIQAGIFFCTSLEWILS